MYSGYEMVHKSFSWTLTSVSAGTTVPRTVIAEYRSTLY